jgi:membrane-associated phospholipid phosphatase
MQAVRLVRVGPPIAWAAATVVMFALAGVPTSHDLLFSWLLLGMLAFTASDFRKRLPRLVVEWAPLIAILFVYDLLRGYADGLLFPAHELPQIRVENWLFGSPAPTVWLQSHLWHGANDLRWWDYLSWFVYLTHFLATLIAAAILWTFAHERFARYATMVCAFAAVGFATYVLFPAVPPWLAAQHGNLGESNRIVPIAWHHIPIAHFSALFEHGHEYANNVAAMPSLHAGYAVLFSLYLWRLVPRWVRPVLAVYPVAMSFALVYTGEHYIVDCIAGWVYAIVTFVAVNYVFDRRRRRAVAPAPALAD